MYAETVISDQSGQYEVILCTSPKFGDTTGGLFPIQLTNFRICANVVRTHKKELCSKLACEWFAEVLSVTIRNGVTQTWPIIVTGNNTVTAGNLTVESHRLNDPTKDAKNSWNYFTTSSVKLRNAETLFLAWAHVISVSDWTQLLSSTRPLRKKQCRLRFQWMPWWYEGKSNGNRSKVTHSVVQITGISR